MLSGVNPARSSPIRLDSAKSRPGFPSAINECGTSWTILEQPPREWRIVRIRQKLMHGGESAHDRMIANLDVTGESAVCSRTTTEIAHGAIVADVAVGPEKFPRLAEPASLPSAFVLRLNRAKTSRKVFSSPNFQNKDKSVSPRRYFKSCVLPVRSSSKHRIYFSPPARTGPQRVDMMFAGQHPSPRTDFGTDTMQITDRQLFPRAELCLLGSTIAVGMKFRRHS